MNPQLHETTLNLISLIYFYKQTGKNNEKINYVIDSSQLLTMQSIEASSEETKQQFCSDAVEAITSVVTDSKAKSIDINNVESLLNKEEVDFIQDLTFNDVRQKFDSESDVIDIKSWNNLGYLNYNLTLIDIRNYTILNASLIKNLCD